MSCADVAVGSVHDMTGVLCCVGAPRRCSAEITALPRSPCQVDVVPRQASLVYRLSFSEAFGELLAKPALGVCCLRLLTDYPRRGG